MGSELEKMSKKEILDYLFDLITDGEAQYLKELTPKIEGRPDDFFEPFYAALKTPNYTHFTRGSESSEDMFQAQLHEFLENVWPELLEERSQSRSEKFVSIPVVFTDDWNADSGMYTVEESSPFYVSEEVEVIDLTPRTEYWETRGTAVMLALEDIDLSSLKKCTNLRELKLSQNRLGSLELYPLKNCERLERIDILKNMIDRLDISPLFACSNLREFKQDSETLLAAKIKLQDQPRPRAL